MIRFPPASPTFAMLIGAFALASCGDDRAALDKELLKVFDLRNSIESDSAP